MSALQSKQLERRDFLGGHGKDYYTEQEAEHMLRRFRSVHSEAVSCLAGV